MMSNQYACINTKIMAMKGYSLQEQDYEKLIEAKDVAGVYNVLKDKTIFSHELDDFDPATGYHRQEIEWRLKRLQVHQSEKFFYYLKARDKMLVSVLLQPMEIAALYRMIRAFTAGENFKELPPQLVYSKKCAHVNFEKLAESQSWDDFKDGLKKSPYYRICEIFTDLDDKKDLFLMEKSIERFYYDTLDQILLEFKGKENQEMVETLRREIDLSNLVWIYRGLFYYHLSKETIIAYALRGGLKVTPKIVMTLLNTRDLKSFIDIVAEMPEYLFLFNHNRTLDLYMERRRSRYLYYAYRKLFHHSNGLGKLTAFIRLVGYETQDVISILESKRYGIEDNALKAFLIRDF